MEYPTEDQIRSAAATSKEAREALALLFPKIFAKPIRPGEIYAWGGQADGGSGVVIRHPDRCGFSFVNFHTGLVYIPYLFDGATSYDLKIKLEGLPLQSLHNCYEGFLKGPMRFKSWCTK